jgi:hypothetical protein
MVEYTSADPSAKKGFPCEMLCFGVLAFAMVLTVDRRGRMTNGLHEFVSAQGSESDFSIRFDSELDPGRSSGVLFLRMPATSCSEIALDDSDR